MAQSRESQSLGLCYRLPHRSDQAVTIVGSNWPVWDLWRKKLSLSLEFKFHVKVMVLTMEGKIVGNLCRLCCWKHMDTLYVRVFFFCSPRAHGTWTRAEAQAEGPWPCCSKLQCPLLCCALMPTYAQRQCCAPIIGQSQRARHGHLTWTVHRIVCENWIWWYWNSTRDIWEMGRSIALSPSTKKTFNIKLWQAGNAPRVWVKIIPKKGNKERV